MIRKGYVDAIPSGQIHYRRADPAAGTNARGSVLLIHQKPSSSRMWEPILPLLAKKGCIAVALDLPGHGESFRPGDNENFTLSTLAKSVSDSIPQLGLPEESPSIVVGHHLGAAVAMQLAVDFPHQVQRLALWGVPILDENTKKFLPLAPDFEDEEIKDVLRFWQVRPRYTSRPGYKMPTRTRVVRLVEMLQSDPRAVDLLLNMEVAELVSKVGQPTLCMYGDGEMLKDATIRAAGEFEKGKLVCIDGAGMDVQDEYPEEFTSAIVEFLLEAR